MRKFVLAILMLVLVSSAAWAGTVSYTPASDTVTYGTGIWGTWTKTWAHLTSANAAGNAWDCRKVRSISVVVTGTWNGATFNLQGSIDNSTFVNLRAASTLTALAQTADSTVITVIFDAPVAYVKPVLTGAGASTDLTCVVYGTN